MSSTLGWSSFHLHRPLKSVEVGGYKSNISSSNSQVPVQADVERRANLENTVPN